MKKIITFAILCAVIGSTAFCQKGVHFGFTSAFNVTLIVNQNNNETFIDHPSHRGKELAYIKSKIFGYHTGGVVGYNFTENLGAQVELIYSKTGTTYEDDFGGSDALHVFRDINLSYFQIPILFKYTSTRGDVARFAGKIGPVIGFLLSSSETLELNGNTITDLDSDKFQSFDAGINLGVGTDIFVMDELYINVGLDFYYGISDINTDIWRYPSKNDVEYEGSHNFRAGLNVGVHYLLPID